MEWISVLLLGFFLGMRHSTDADHVVAVTTIVSQQKKLSFAALIGIVWGLGHTFTIFIVGIGIIYLKFTISPHLGLSLEFGVGLMIVILGIISLFHFIPHRKSTET
ncbi:MAG TPA: urease accessory protein UreH, partial [Bacilli bacterium]